MAPLRRVLGKVLIAIDRAPWWAIVLGLILALIALIAAASEAAAPGTGKGVFVVQNAIQGIVVGSIYVLGASGLSLTYGIKKFANFAHGDMMTVGAYAAYTVNVLMGGDIFVSAVVAMVTVAVVGMVLELTIFARLEGRGPVPALIASVGVGLVLQNLIGAIFLGDVRYMNVGIPTDFPIGDTGLRFNSVKGGVTLATSIGLVIMLHVLLKYTTLGKAMRACADDLELARTSGINTRNVILWTWAISGTLAAIAGLLLAILVNVTPLLGFIILLYVFAAVIIGGIGSPYGAMIGGLIIGLVQKLSAVVFDAASQAGYLEGGAAYEPAGAFLVMILVLLVKPEGLMGISRERMGRRLVLPMFLRSRGAA